MLEARNIEAPDERRISDHGAMDVVHLPGARTAGAGDAWWFLGVRIDELSTAGGARPPVFVSTAVLPEGASAPLHVHGDLDDSFYLLEGLMVVRCGDDVSVATAGTWVPFPKGVPHTFRVMDGPARTLIVHANDSFLRAVRDIGRPARATDIPTTEGGPSAEELHRRLAAHDITTVGPPMEEPEARAWLRELSVYCAPPPRR